MNQLSLFELNSLVHNTIANALPDLYWVEAELMEIRESKGHCYMELVQKDIFSAVPVARASAKCWRSQWLKVGQKFFKATGGYPASGMKLLLNVTVDFHPAYGFSLIVNDIDPTYTLGDMARKRQEIIRTLKEEGVYDLQKELSLPIFCQRIAVISSATAAGYGDFCNQLFNNEHGLKFKTELFPATMQGDRIEESIIQQLDNINNRLEEFDCVVIIRGGGATSDMSGFDTLMLAENVANFPLPIITGIGHERDECVLDLISFQRVKTPTAAAAFLINHLADVLGRIEDAQNTIITSVALKMERQHNLLSQLTSEVTSAARLYVTRQEARLDHMFMRQTNSIKQRLVVENHRLNFIIQRITLLDPQLLLKRGYSITMHNGQLVRDASKLKKGDEIKTIFEKGTTKSIVK